MEEDLRRSPDELDARVRERTAERAAANARLERNIADRGKAQERLRKSEERFRILTDSLPGIILSAPGDGLLDYLSISAPASTPACQWSKGWAGWLGFVRPGGRQRAWESWQRSLESRGVFERE